MGRGGKRYKKRKRKRKGKMDIKQQYIQTLNSLPGRRDVNNPFLHDDRPARANRSSSAKVTRYSRGSNTQDFTSAFASVSRDLKIGR